MLNSRKCNFIIYLIFISSYDIINCIIFLCYYNKIFESSYEILDIIFVLVLEIRNLKID